MSKYEEIKSFENDIKPNRFVCDAIIWVFMTIFAANFFDEFGVFHLTNKWQMRIPFVAVTLMAIFSVIIVSNKKRVAKPSTKIILLQFVMIATMVTSVCLDQFCYISVFFPVICATVYHDKKLFLQAIIGTIIIAFSTPLLCLLFNTWDVGYYAYIMKLVHYNVVYTYDLNNMSAINVLTNAVVYISFPRVIVVSALSIAMYYASKSASSNVELRAKIEYVAERDVLTGLLNRQSYENSLSDYRKHEVISKIGCVYGDADGLHEINNKKGHLAGDKLLISCAEVLNECFFNCKIYRVGGDEFVVVTHNMTEEDIKDRVNQVGKIIQSKGYHLSLGYKYSENCLNITDLVNKAEDMMYNNKNKYCEEHHIENRNIRNRND